MSNSDLVNNSAMAEQVAKILPIPGKDNVLITSALPYVNNTPHLGNVIGSILSADVFARYSRLRDRPTLFICGTDEYGTATETAALAQGVTPEELCAKYRPIHKSVYDWFEIKCDYFGKTTTPAQTKIVQDAFAKNLQNGYFEERTTTQPYCPKHDGFLADRFVEGTCPKCAYPDARGDQCDKCGSVLDPLELIDPRCKIDGGTPVPKETSHMFLQLDKLQPQVEEWFQKSSTEGKWSQNGINITKAWLAKGLQPRSMTRDMKWGVPVPHPGYDKKVFYVWFDACFGYPSITANLYPDDWEKWWKNPKDVRLVQFLGKDNVPFHSVMFPSALIGAEKGVWTMLNMLSTCEYINYEDTKFSKSRGVGVFGDNAKDTGVPPPVWRYYLLSNRPETSDTQFMWNDFVAANNNELLANLGNFINRTVKFAISKFDSKVPPFSASYTDPSFDFLAWISDVDTLLTSYREDMELARLRAGIKKAMEISAKGNQLVQKRVDNAALAAHPERTAVVIGLALNLCSLLASVISPYMPSTADSIARQLGLDAVQSIPDKFNPEALQAGHVLGKAELLFSRIDEKKIPEWRELYSGTQEQRKAEAEAKRLKEEAKKRDKERKAARKAAKKLEEAGEATGDSKQLPIREKPAPVEQ